MTWSKQCAVLWSYLTAIMRTGWDLCTFCLGDVGCRALDPEVGSGLRLSWPFWRSGVVSDCMLHVEYKLSNDEFMSFTKASRSTSSSERQSKSSITYVKVADKINLGRWMTKFPPSCYIFCSYNFTVQIFISFTEKRMQLETYKNTDDHVCLLQQKAEWNISTIIFTDLFSICIVFTDNWWDF